MKSLTSLQQTSIASHNSTSPHLLELLYSITSFTSRLNPSRHRVVPPPLILPSSTPSYPVLSRRKYLGFVSSPTQPRVQRHGLPNQFIWEYSLLDQPELSPLVVDGECMTIS
ncbi:hypothetical protein ABVK25_002139 [Lepraria finkii]|uniref:Uncharacterized protein n=1 Tax=Lepraria finkii TaxID=1340010 RepID=A0ABR4BIV6_9LECA